MTNSDTTPTTEARWYALRDLKRPNAIRRAWEMLQEDNRMEVFTPKKWTLVSRKGRRMPKEVAFIPDLLFAHETREALDAVIENTETLQYRFRKYGTQNEPITVPDTDMERFIHAVNSSKSTRFYTPGEILPGMYGKTVRIVGGPLEGYEGRLLSARGSRTRRLLVELQGFLVAAVEVSPEYIQLKE